MKTWKYGYRKEIAGIGFEGIFPPETTVLACSLTSKGRFLDHEWSIWTNWLFGEQKVDTYHSKPNSFTTTAATFDYPHI